MRKSKKTIIYMLVAVFVALSTVLVDFNMSYAQSSYSDVPDADWVYISGGNINNTEFNKGVLDVLFRMGAPMYLLTYLIANILRPLRIMTFKAIILLAKM